MTDEQIKQNAKNYVHSLRDDRDMGKYDYNDMEKSYIKGAHSRDEEIKELQKENLYMESLLSMHRKMTGEYELKLQKLHNPWISVEDRLPEKLENDCASYYVLTRMDGPRQIWYMVNRYNYDIKSWEGCNNNTTHWMPIPQLKEA